MSRIGKKVVSIPKGVTVTLFENGVKVKGPKGELTRPFAPHTSIELLEVGGVKLGQVNRDANSKFARSCHGLMRALLNNMVIGVSQGFVKRLIVDGVGYKAQVQGKKLVLSLGYSRDRKSVV